MYSQALRFNAGLSRAIFAVILSFLCIFLFAGKGFVEQSFAAPQDETITGTMSIVLDTSQDPDTPIPSPDPDNPNPNPGDGGDGNNGDNSQTGGAFDSDNQDALKANSINKDGNNKDSLASTGDVFATTLIAILALATVLTTFVYVSRWRLALNTGKTFSPSNNRAKSAALVLLTLTLLSGTIFSAFKAFAEGEDADTLTNSTATLNAKVVVDENGKIKSTELILKNNLKTAVTVKSISAPAEVADWTANVDTDTVVAAGDTLTKDWTPDTEAIPAELLSKLNNGEEVNLTFSTEVSYTAFNITWNLNGGQGIIATSPVPENGNVVLPSTNPTFDHYTFEGWNTQSDGQGDAVDENTVVTSDVTFYAQWTPETYAINFQFPDGGEFAGGVTPEKTYTYGVGVDSFEEPYKQGYDFDGWYDASTGGNKVTSITTTDFGNKTLYARWTPITYTVKFDKNDTSATGTMADQTFTYDAAQNLKTNTFTKPNSTFAGWAETPTGDVKYTDSQQVKNLASTQGASVTLYAKWNDRQTFTVTFNTEPVIGDLRVNGAFKVGDDGRFITISEVSVKDGDVLPNPDIEDLYRIPYITTTESDYVFDGWYTLEDGSGERGIIGTTKVTKDITYYAKFVASTTFIAPKATSVTANPRRIQGIKYPIEYVKAAADDIKAKGTGSAFYSVFNDWMTNDSYHLYTLLKSGSSYQDPTNTDSWAEFRIIQVGQHDNDGSGLTFQMVHGLPNTYAFDSAGKTGADLNWASSTLRNSLNNNGEILSQFDSNLIATSKTVSKKYNTTAGAKPSESTILTSRDTLWILSYTEYQSNVNTTYWSKDQLGSTYAFWNHFSINNDVASDVDQLKKLCATRSGTLLKDPENTYGDSWQRSVSPDNGANALNLGSLGNLNSNGGHGATALRGVNVCFAV